MRYTEFMKKYPNLTSVRFSDEDLRRIERLAQKWETTFAHAVRLALIRAEEVEGVAPEKSRVSVKR